MDGKNVGILNRVATCIYSLKPTGMNCDEVIELGFDTLAKPEFATNAKKVIKTALDKGRGTSVGNKFAVLVSSQSSPIWCRKCRL